MSSTTASGSTGARRRGPRRGGGGGDKPETPSSSRVGAATGRKTAKNGSNGHEIEPATSSDADTSPLSAAARRVVEKQMAKLAEELAELQETSPQAEAQIEELKEKLRVIRGEVMEALVALQDEVGKAVEGALTDVSATFAAATKSGGKAGKQAVRDKSEMFGEKKFRVRPSELSKMLMNPDIQSIYNIAVTILLWSGIHLIVEDVSAGKPPDFSLLFWAFGKQQTVFWTWVGVLCLALLALPIVQLVSRTELSAKVWGVPYLMYQGVMWVAPTWLTVHAELPPASGFIVMCETARLSMKVHAYVREKVLHGVPRYEKYRKFIPDWARARGVTEETLNLPHITIEGMGIEMGRYMYFLFAPTLVYRDSYPRVGTYVRWSRVIYHLLNTLGAILYTFVIFRTLCTPYFAKTAEDPGNLNTFVVSVFQSMIPGMFVLILAFFGVLHSWFNMFSELLTFGDRRFYEDWWNAGTFATYYRKWNVVVHEFLKYYVYNDIVRFGLGSVGKTAAQLFVFLISSILHEAIIAAAMGYFYPVLLLMFGGPGVLFTRLRGKSSAFTNVFMWLMLSVGTGLLMVLYSREFYARQDSAATAEIEAQIPGSWYNFMVPRSWVVYTLATSPAAAADAAPAAGS